MTRSAPDSQTYPPFAVQFDSETSKGRDRSHWSRSFAFAGTRESTEDTGDACKFVLFEKSTFFFLTWGNPDLTLGISKRVTQAELPGRVFCRRY